MPTAARLRNAGRRGLCGGRHDLQLGVPMSSATIEARRHHPMPEDIEPGRPSTAAVLRRPPVLPRPLNSASLASCVLNGCPAECDKAGAFGRPGFFEFCGGSSSAGTPPGRQPARSKACYSNHFDAFFGVKDSRLPNFGFEVPPITRPGMKRYFFRIPEAERVATSIPPQRPFFFPRGNAPSESFPRCVFRSSIPVLKTRRSEPFFVYRLRICGRCVSGRIRYDPLHSAHRIQSQPEPRGRIPPSASCPLWPLPGTRPRGRLDAAELFDRPRALGRRSGDLGRQKTQKVAPLTKPRPTSDQIDPCSLTALAYDAFFFPFPLCWRYRGLFGGSHYGFRPNQWLPRGLVRPLRQASPDHHVSCPVVDPRLNFPRRSARRTWRRSNGKIEPRRCSWLEPHAVRHSLPHRKVRAAALAFGFEADGRQLPALKDQSRSTLDVSGRHLGK